MPGITGLNALADTGLAPPEGWRGVSLPVESVALRVEPGEVGLGVGITGVVGATVGTLGVGVAVTLGTVGVITGVLGAVGAAGGFTAGGGATTRGGPTAPCAPAGGDTAAKRAAATNPPTARRARILDVTPMRRSHVAMRIEPHSPEKLAVAQHQTATDVNEPLPISVPATLLR